MAVSNGRFRSAPGRIEQAFPIDRRTLANRSDLGLTQAQARGAIRTLERVSFFDRIAPDRGSCYQRLDSGDLHPKPVPFRVNSVTVSFYEGMQRRPGMTPEAFIAKWKPPTSRSAQRPKSTFSTSAACSTKETPAKPIHQAQATASSVARQRPTAARVGLTSGSVGSFAWEYKGRGKELCCGLCSAPTVCDCARKPTLLVVCNLDRFRIHTNWNNTVVSSTSLIGRPSRSEPSAEAKAVLSNPEELRSGKTRRALTEQADSDFAGLAQRLRERGHTPEAVALHRSPRLCMFARTSACSRTGCSGAC